MMSVTFVSMKSAHLFHNRQLFSRECFEEFIEGYWVPVAIQAFCLYWACH